MQSMNCRALPVRVGAEPPVHFQPENVMVKLLVVPRAIAGTMPFANQGASVSSAFPAPAASTMPPAPIIAPGIAPCKAAYPYFGSEPEYLLPTAVAAP